ncbi:MAG: hypothetical protein M1114_02620, partial [Candidatus Dependentiae bacterium]|nr:hypothetical protein [Candidatus Dependentiae bacterium]
QPANTTQQPLAEAGQATGELKTTSDAFSLTEHGWNLSENGSMINGRYYSKHALERMAPRTPEVMAILEKRAHARNFEEYDDFLKYVQPREIPPMVIEDAIKNGAKSIGTSKYGDTLIYITDEIKVITNLAGDVVSVYRI